MNMRESVKPTYGV